MRRRSVHVAALVAAFALLTGGGCTGGLFRELYQPGRIDVTNNSPEDEPAVVGITADDLHAYAYLTRGATTSVHTIAGGNYHVRVVMSGSDADRYRDDLNGLKGYAEKLLAGTADLPEQAAAFFRLQAINDDIARLIDDVTPGCDGTIKLDAETAQTVTATVTWRGAIEFWQALCESN